MSAFVSDCQSVSLTQFSGAWIPSQGTLDVTKIPQNSGQTARNVQFFAGSVGSRYGHSAVTTPGVAMTSLVNWVFTYGTPIATPHNYLVFFVPGVGVQMMDLAVLTPSTIIPQTTAANAFITPFGARIYVAFVDANGIGTAPGVVYGFGIGADVLFAAPITTAPTFSELGSNLTTTGPKLFGFLIQTRNGYLTRPSPSPSDNFTATPYTSLGGAIIMSISATWPDYAKQVCAIMSTTANPADFRIVPSPFPGGSPFWPVSRTGPTLIPIEVTDALLASDGIPAQPYLDQLGQSVTGTAPIEPSYITPFGDRMNYFCLDAAGISVCYSSDASNPQSINAATSGLYLPGQLGQVTGFALRNEFYQLGPHWTFSAHDAGGAPATWASPQQVDGGIGALGAGCVSLNASQSYAWVADEAGLYLFQGGSFPPLPVSYYQRADWMRINFAAASTIQVADDKPSQQVHVLVPLDGATSPTHVLSWDYSNGTDPDTIMYCGAGNLAGYRPGAMAMVQNQTTKHLERWLGPSDPTQPIGRENNGSEPFPYRDFNRGIDALWETAVIPQGMGGRLINHCGERLRISGKGTVSLTAYAMDHSFSAGPYTIPSQMTTPQGSTLTPNPGAEIMQGFFLMNEGCSAEIRSDGLLDSWWILSKVDHFYTPSFPSR
jgi:hypothetical protein